MLPSLQLSSEKSVGDVWIAQRVPQARLAAAKSSVAVTAECSRHHACVLNFVLCGLFVAVLAVVDPSSCLLRWRTVLRVETLLYITYSIV